MADKAEFLQAIDDAILDADSLERFINGSDSETVLTRLSAEYPTLQNAISQINDKLASADAQTKQGITTLFENGGFPATPFDTKAKMTTDGASLADGDYAWVTDDTDANNGLYIKKLGAWKFSEFNVLKRVQDYVADLDKKVILSQGPPLDAREDVAGQVYQYTDVDSNLHVAGDVYANGKLLGAENNSDSENIDKLRYQSILMQKYPPVKNLVPIATKDEDGLRARMPFGIVTPTGLLCFYHKQMAGYDGDNEGSELHKAFITIDDELNATVVSRELFLAPEVPTGIIKHPMLGRTSDNRILLMYERRPDRNTFYTRYQCYSSDEGVTFSTPTVVEPSGVNPATRSALGTTGVIVTARNGRLIVPMYTSGGYCYVIYSDDDGTTWTFSPAFKTSKGVEPSVSLDLDDNLVMDIRPRVLGNRIKAKSFDNGETWQVFNGEALISATNQGVIFRDKSIGAMIQTHSANNISGGYSVRTHFTLSISYDNMETYEYSYMPYGVDWYGGYSQLLKWRDGVYVLIIEYADTFTAINTNENAGLVILTLNEVLSNVSHN